MKDETTTLQALTPTEQEGEWQLRKLSPQHKQVAALVAQGVRRELIAAACDFTPEYVTFLQRQPLFIDYLKEMSAAASVRLEAMFDQSVNIVAEAMTVGTIDERLKGARLQMEATGRVGKMQGADKPPPGSDDRLEQLAQRLVGLLQGQRSRVIDSTATEVQI